MIENKVNSTSSAVESQSNRSPWTQIVLGGESEPIMEKEKSDNSGLVQGNAEKKPVWNRPSNVDSGIRPVMGASSWPALSETTIAPPSNKSSSDSLKSLSDGSSSSSSVPPLSQVCLILLKTFFAFNWSDYNCFCRDLFINLIMFGKLNDAFTEKVFDCENLRYRRDNACKFISLSFCICSDLVM